LKNFKINSAVTEASSFLTEFKARLVTPLAFFCTAPVCKGLKALCKLGFTNHNLTEHLLALEPSDFVQGPISSADGMPPLWVFGRTIYTAELRVEASLGPISHPYACIAYSIAESPMTYPLRQLASKRTP
jgi:hypothetical protein